MEVSDDVLQTIQNLIENEERYIPDDAAEFIEGYGLTHISADVATTRWAFKTPEGTVVKFPKKPWTRECNEDEVRHWRELSDTGLLTPIVDYDDENYWWVEMEYRESVGSMETLSEFRQRMDEAGCHLKDIHEENVGVCPETGEPQCIDYASGIQGEP